MDFDWKSIAGTVAPLAPKLGAVLGTGLGGPLGGIIGGLAGNALAAAFGVEETPEAVGKAIAEDPNAAQKIQQLEANRGEEIRAQAQAKIEELKQQTKQFQIAADDTDRARQYNLGLVNVSSPLSWGVALLATVYTAAFFVVLAIVLANTALIKENQLLMLLLACLTTGQGQILNYFFGSSAGSKDKDMRFDAMAAAQLAKPNPSPSTVDLVRAAAGKKK